MMYNDNSDGCKSWGKKFFIGKFLSVLLCVLLYYINEIVKPLFSQLENLFTNILSVQSPLLVYILMRDHVLNRHGPC